MKTPRDGESLKEIAQKKRKVFKPILTNPYTNQNEWPRIEKEALLSILELLTSTVLRDTGRYNALNKEEKKLSVTTVPEDRQYVSYGYNSTMTALENQIQRVREGKATDSLDTVTHVFVCKADMASNLLWAPFPTMCCLGKVKLVQLPKGANQKLSKALGVGKSVEVLVLREGIVQQYPVFREFVDKNVGAVEIGFLTQNETLDLDMRFLLLDQPVGRRVKKGQSQAKKGKNKKKDVKS